MFLFLATLAFGYDIYSTWSQHPDLIVCQDSGVNNKKVLDAIDYWSNRGYKVNDIIFKKNCEEEIIQGKIVIFKDYGRVKEKEYGRTHVVWKDGHMAHATVFISKDALDSLTVIKHEIGHAFGIKHTEDIHDIMYVKVSNN